MSRKSTLLVLSMFLFLVSQALAATRSFITSESTKNAHNKHDTNLTPRERIRLNEQKADTNPGLRGRWNPKSHEPASETSQLRENLAEKILLNFRQDRALARIPLKLKVSSSRGVVTLDGVVNNEEERSFIENKVRRMEGVKDVVDHLKIKRSDKDLLD